MDGSVIRLAALNSKYSPIMGLQNDIKPRKKSIKGMVNKKKKLEKETQAKDPLGQELGSDGDNTESQESDFYLKTIESLRKERGEYHDLLLRKQAEFENYRKRILKEKNEVRIEAQGELVKGLLPVVDACEKGLETMEDEPALETYRQGYELLLKQLRSVLERFDVTEIQGLGAHFDPTIHEAVTRELTTKHEEGTILDEYRKGYKINNRLLRPSQVKVAVQPDK